MRMPILSCSLFSLVALVGVVSGDSPEPPLSDHRLSVHTLVREDIFSGWQSNNMERFARGERSIDQLLKDRPQEKAHLLAWKGAAILYRAVLAHEADEIEEFEHYYQQSRELLAQARKLAPESVGIAAVIGGSSATFADRLPDKQRAIAWDEAYDSYQLLWKLQEPTLEKLPVHIRGELLAGLAQSAQRTGRKEEMDRHLAKILEVLPDTPYAQEAEIWRNDPQVAIRRNISCKTCHTPGRLSATIARLDANPPDTDDDPHR